jgi:energy-coupling factor transporter ATP-binding protein EcfA2
MADLDDFALRRAERGLITGGTGTGKSTLMEFLINDFVHRYPTGRTVIADTKPRFRAEMELNGLPAKRRYKGWDHGTVIPGSVAGDLSRSDGGLGDAWKLGHRVVILQTDTQREWPLILRAMAAFFRQARTSRPQLAAVDETMDFFGSNGQPIPGLGEDRDALLRIVRAGRERGMGGLFGMQRPKGVPVPIVQELTRLYLFRLDNDDDVERLWDLGIRVEPPDRDHEFRYWKRGVTGSRLLKLNLPGKTGTPPATSGGSSETIAT